MKARMSQSVSRLEDVTATDPLVRAYAGEAALEEVEAIMAEVEPDGPQTFLVGIERLQGDKTAPDPWTAALADALAAFVEDSE